MRRSLGLLVLALGALSLALPFAPQLLNVVAVTAVTSVAQLRELSFLVLLCVGAFVAVVALALMQRRASSGADWSRAVALRPGAIGNLTEKIRLALFDIVGAQYIGGARGSVDFASMATILQSRVNLTVSGALLGDFADFAPETDVEAGLQLSAWVSAADTVTLCCSNNTAGTIDPAAVIFRVRVTRESRRS